MKWRKGRIAWSVGILFLAALLLPVFEPVQESGVPHRPHSILYWPVIVGSIILVAVLWMPQKFSLQYLLIATTLITVALWLAMLACK